jgi:hypothetical protein
MIAIVLAGAFTKSGAERVWRRVFGCPGCGGRTDGRHLDRRLLPKVRR